MLGWEGAFEAARRILGVPARGAMPSHGLVRRHLEALEEARLGAEGAREVRRTRVLAIVELLEFVRFVLDPSDIVVVGLLAREVAVGPLEVHARVFEGKPFQGLFEQLESVGVREVLASSTSGPMGRFESVRFDSDGERFTLTRIPREQRAYTTDRNLVTGRPIPQVSLETFSGYFAASS